MFHLNVNSDFDRFFDSFFINNYIYENKQNVPYYNIVKDNDNYIFEFYLPGFKRENIEINIENDYLLISAKKIKKDSIVYLKKSSFDGIYTEKIKLNGGMDSQKIKAEFIDGVLIVTIPKYNKILQSKTPIMIE